MSSSARRALKVMEVVGRSEHPIGVTEIAKQLGIPPGSAFRALDALRDHHFVDRYQASSRYVNGSAAIRLRQSLFARFKIRDVALPYLRQLASTSGETASLIVPLGWYGVRIASARGSNEVTLAPTLGAIGPLGTHYASKAILAFSDAATISRYLAWEERHSPRRVVAAAIRPELAAIGRHGFAYEETGFAKGKASLAFPVRHRGNAIAAIALEGPVLDLPPPLHDEQVKSLGGAVEAIEGIVGARARRCENPFGQLDPDQITLDASW